MYDHKIMTMHNEYTCYIHVRSGNQECDLVLFTWRDRFGETEADAVNSIENWKAN